MTTRKTTTKKIGKGRDVPKISKELCLEMLTDLESAQRPVIEATKCSLDNSNYSPKVGYLTPGEKKVRSELNLSLIHI